MSRTAATTTVLAIALTLGAAEARAQGFQVNEHGSCQMGRGETGVAAPCRDGSAMFGNPAGIVGDLGWTISAGVTVIDAHGGFTEDLTGANTKLANDPILVPHGYVVYGISDKVAAGLGVFVPYGLGTVWPVTFAGRFSGYDNDLRSIYVQPTLAIKPHPMLSIGAGFDFVISELTLTQRVDLSEFDVPGQPITFGQLGIPFHTDAANALLKGDGTAFGGHFGILFEPSEKFSIGARYMTRVTIDYDGTVVFDPAASLVLPPFNPIALANPTIDPTLPLPLSALLAPQFLPGGALADGGVETAITMPDQISAGIAIKPVADFTFMVDYQWVHWSLFDTLPLDFTNEETPDRVVIEDYENTHAVRVGFDWATSDRLSLRSGYIYHTAAAPPQTVTPLLPEGKRSEITFGLGYALSDALRADVAYQYIRQQDRRGRVREAPAGQPTTIELNSGLYDFFAHLVGVTLTARF